MRQIKFRAQDIASNKWLYGDLRHHKDDVCIFEQGGTKGEQVKRDTIGQFVGLKDKNGKEIYEGDIVECVSWNEYFSKDGKPMEPFRRKMFVDYRKGGFKMVEPMPEPMKDNEWDIICNGDIVVIGNIHDDPQLIDMKRLG
jgi:uncharacterized phage protein (TIGR01671 family)